MTKINVIGSVSKTGYGIVTLNILKAMRKAKWNVSLFPKGKVEVDNQQDASTIQWYLSNAEYFPYEAPCLSIWHQFDLCQTVGKGPKIAYPFFELDSFTDKEKHHLKYNDCVIASSQWAKTILEKEADVDNVCIASPGVDRSIFFPVQQKERDTTVFLNCGKWEIRKGHDVLIDMFNKAFTESDDVQLWLMPHNQFLTESETSNWEHYYLNTKMGRCGKIKILPWQKTNTDVAKIMNMADCGIFPSRAEGWNLELLEMMSVGKHVIATNYSAHTEFCNEDNCMLIDIDDKEFAYDGKWFFDQGNWAIIGDKQIEQSANFMRDFHFSRPTEKNLMGIKTAETFSWENTLLGIEKSLIFY